jgi:hypothetical protein
MIVTLLGSCIRFNYISSDFACHAVLSSSMLNLADLYFVFSLLISECTFLFNRADDKDHVEAQDSNTDDS